MLQWKPRLIVVLVVLALIAVALGQLTWDSFSQLTW
jgi:DNA-binding transcriptional regulator of glucitol operon